jgi:hypothetical protein
LASFRRVSSGQFTMERARGEVGAVRRGNYTLIEDDATGRLELYDPAADPGEADDLSDVLPSVAESLRDPLRAWLDGMGG